MKILKNKKKTTADQTKLTVIALLLMFTISFSLVALPTATAHTPPWTVPTYTYVSVTNNVIGVDQQFTVVFWTAAYPPTANGAYGDRWTFTVEVTKPDGSKDIIGPITSDPVGSGWTNYKPTQLGTYTVVAKVAEHLVTGLPKPEGGYFMGGDAYVNDTFAASSSDPVTVTVQQNPIDGWPEAPLPTEFWTRPINEANRNWAYLASNWLAGSAQSVGPTSNFAFGTGPESAHIMWATPMWSGGIMDARFSDTGYSTSDYEGLSFNPPIVLDGKVFYNVQSLPKYGWYCLDLYTGETLYFHNTTGPISTPSGSSSGAITGGALAFGQIFNYESPNQHGGKPYLWSTGSAGGFMESGGSTWMMFDAYTGNYMCSINNVPSWAGGGGFFGGGGVSVYGDDGSLTYYNIVGTSDPSNPMAPATAPYYLQCWNTTQAIWWKPVWGTTFAEYWLWRPGLNVTYDGNNGYTINATVPQMSGSLRVVREDQFAIGGTSGKNNGSYVEKGNLWALSLKPGEEGKLLWNITFTPPQSVPDRAITGVFGGGSMSGPTIDPEDGVFIYSQSLTRQWWGFNLTTGQQIWGPTDPEPQMKFYGMTATIYDGKLISSTGLSSGDLYAYDIQTGELLWVYNATQVGFESPYGNYPISVACVCDGKIYAYSTEHSPTQPLWRGSYLRCINATDGTEVWKVLHWGPAVAADGFLVGLNFYDNQIYCYGKGPSGTTVTVAPKTSTEGDSVLIEGTVTDQTPAQAGTPAISDEDMQAWMEYMYAQQAKPTDAKGVTVHLTAFDPNGNTQEIGTVNSDIYGNFAKQWYPPVPGVYEVIATFEGSAAYYGSSAETAFAVGTAPAASPKPTAPQASPTQAPASPTQAPTQPVSPSPSPAVPPTSGVLTTTYIAIGAAVVVIVVAAAALALRKRKTS
jgi:hypothetical protein